MRSDDRNRSDESQALFGYLAAGLAASLLVVYVAPAIGIGIALGCMGAAALTWRPSDRRSKSDASQCIAAGLTVLAAYVLTRSRLGAAGENRRLSREWGMGEVGIAAFLHHPWAWVPVACGTSLIVGGIVCWLQTR